MRTKKRKQHFLTLSPEQCRILAILDKLEGLHEEMEQVEKTELVLCKIHRESEF